MNRRTFTPITRPARIRTKAQRQASRLNGCRGGRPRKPTLMPDLKALFHAPQIHDTRPRRSVLGEHLLYDRVVQGLITCCQPMTNLALVSIAELARTILEVHRLDRAIDALTSPQVGNRGSEVFGPDEMAAWAAVEQSADRGPAFVGQAVGVDVLAVVARLAGQSAQYRKEKAAEKAQEEAPTATRRVRKSDAAAPTKATQGRHAGQEPDRPLDIFSLINTNPGEFEEFTDESLVISMLRGHRLLSPVQRLMWKCLVPSICSRGRMMTADSIGPGLSSSDRAARLEVGQNLKDNAAQLVLLSRQRVTLLASQERQTRWLIKLCKMSA